MAEGRGAETGRAASPHAFRWPRALYDRLIEEGILGPETRVELVDGEVIEMTPQGSRHAAAVRLAQRALERAFGAGFDVRAQLPLALGEWSEPEPDVSVVRGGPRDYTARHPASAELVVEVSDASLAFDADVKQRLYACHGIPEYWILDLPHGRLRVHRAPGEGGYREVRELGPGDAVTPVAAPGRRVRVADLLP